MAILDEAHCSTTMLPPADPTVRPAIFRKVWRFSGGRDSETRERCAGPMMWRPLERRRSGWDGEFESPLLQRRVCKLSVPVCSGSTGPMICTRSVMEGRLQALYSSLKLPRNGHVSAARSAKTVGRYVPVPVVGPGDLSRSAVLPRREFA
jgi:hypothetical protein